jgi:hypothetical protein
MMNFNHSFLTNMFRPKHIGDKIVILFVIYVLWLLDVLLRSLEKFFYARNNTFIWFGCKFLSIHVPKEQ